MVGARGVAAAAGRAKQFGADPRPATLRSVADPDDSPGRRPGRPRRSRSDRLSGKERLVLVELARGRSTDEIGEVLSVSPHTVRTHVKNLMRKLGARTRAHAVAIALCDRAIDIRG